MRLEAEAKAKADAAAAKAKPESPATSQVAQTSPAAPGGCRTESFAFSAVNSDKVSVKSVSTAGAPCPVKVAPQHPDLVQFTSASIVKQPGHGSFTQVGDFEFKYQPVADFRGMDQYAIKVCGHNSQRGGCATLTYNVTVN